MLELLNPTLPAMSLQCCSHYPYCSHQSRQAPSQNLHSVGLGVTFGHSWDCSTSPPYESQFSYARQPQDIHYSTEDTTSSAFNPRAMPTTSGLPVNSHRSSWNPAEVQGHEYSTETWSSGRNPTQEMSMEASHYNNGYDYVGSGTQYHSYGYREFSPSRTTDLSTVSVSSQSSPATLAAGYDVLVKNDDGHSYLPSQPTIPETLEVANSRMQSPYSPGSSGYTSESRSKGSRSRKSKAQEMIHCQICLKAFDRKSNYKSHCEIHEKDRQRIKCKIPGCDKTFGRPAEMTRHVNSAHKQKSYNCESCGKDFTRNDILIRHRNDACPKLHNTSGSMKKRRGRSQS